MSNNTSIQWTDRRWNPVRGCSRVSPGCDSCYAMGQAHRFAGPGLPYEGLTTIRRGKVDWSGTARLVPGELDKPIRWRTARKIFVNSMSDLFHHSLSDDAIDRVYGTMWASMYLGRHAAPGHIFQVLTKRADRLRDYLSTDRREKWASAAVAVGGGIDPDGLYDQVRFSNAPHPRIWHGVSVENQKTADDRVSLLLETPSAVRFISAEPLLEDVSLFAFLKGALRDRCLDTLNSPPMPGLDWVIIGGESGPRARPFHVDWARSIVRDCRAAGVPVFVKQLGARYCDPENGVGGALTVPPPEYGKLSYRLVDRAGGDMSEWPNDLRVREFPRAA